MRIETICMLSADAGTPTPTPTLQPVSGIYPDWINVNTTPFSDEKNPVPTAENVTDINALYVADPCLYAGPGGPLYLFMEVYDGNFGRIGLVRSMDDGRTLIYDRMVLVDGYHHSYPRVFKANGRYLYLYCSEKHSSLRLGPGEMRLFALKKHHFEITSKSNDGFTLSFLLHQRAFLCI